MLVTKINTSTIIVYLFIVTKAQTIGDITEIRYLYSPY